MTEKNKKLDTLEQGDNRINELSNDDLGNVISGGTNEIHVYGRNTQVHNISNWDIFNIDPNEDVK